MTIEGKLWLSGSVAVSSALLTVLILIGRWAGGQTVASNQSTQSTNKPIAPASNNAVNYTVLTRPVPIPPPGSPRPSLPQVREFEVKLDDPHFCKKPDDAYFANNGHHVPMPAGSGEFHDPQFLFDTKHNDRKITWAGQFTGSVITCFVVNDAGEPTDITFPASPGTEIEEGIKAYVSGWRYKPGWYNENYRDLQPHVVSTQMAFDFLFR
jgi:hypothetical protein